MLAPPPKEDTLQFWGGLWGDPKYFNREASWINTIDQEYAPMEFSQLSLADFTLALKKLPNWKSPDPDLISGFWLKKFYSLHGSFLYRFNEMLLGSSPIPQSLVTGRTVLIVKDHLKGNIPSNY